MKSGSQPGAGDVQRREHVDVAQVHRKTSLVMMMMVKMIIVMLMMVMILMMMMVRTSAQVHRKTWLTHFSLNDHEVDSGLDWMIIRDFNDIHLHQPFNLSNIIVQHSLVHLRVILGDYLDYWLIDYYFDYGDYFDYFDYFDYCRVQPCSWWFWIQFGWFLWFEKATSPVLLRLSSSSHSQLEKGSSGKKYVRWGNDANSTLDPTSTSTIDIWYGK